MMFEEAYNDIISSFGSLWNFKERGASLEIITPYVTTSQKFISVFLTVRDGDYIVTDGGWIHEGVYNNSFDKNAICFNKSFHHFQSSFHVSEVERRSGVLYFYKKTKDKASIPSLIFDLSHFISAIASLSEVDFREEDQESDKRFATSARDFLDSNIRGIVFNDFLDFKRKAKVNAIVKKPNNRLVLINYITGSNYYNFRGSISKTLMIFELATASLENQYVDSKIALVDDLSRGYVPSEVSNWLDLLISKPQTRKIEWTNKTKLLEI